MSDKKTQLIEASIDLFAQEGFWNTPTSRIAKHAGVATGTLFNYFESKEVLIDEVYLELKRGWFSHILDGFPQNGDVKEILEHVWFRNIDWAVNNSVHSQLLQQLKLSNLVSVETQRSQEEEWASMVTILQDGFAQGLFADISIEYFAAIYVASIEAAVSIAMSQNLKDMALTKHIAQGFVIFWKGITK